MSPTKKKPVPQGAMAAYQARVASGAIQPDALQAEVAGRLDALAVSLARKRGLFGARTPVPGMYIWGDVGRGKSMLMDLFFESVPMEPKRRVHFHAFMQETHAAIHRIRVKRTGDPVGVWVAELAGQCRLLCFDELQATDVADASLLFRLFEGLLEAGIVIVATSNRAPAHIYQGGVQAERFEKFSQLLEARLQVMSLMGETDYRLGGVAAEHYFWPLGAEAEARLLKLLPNGAPMPVGLELKGRTLWIEAYADGTARASFAELCEAALGPSDYLAIASRFHTLALTGIPKLSPEKRNEAKRFVTLIDALYEHKVRLLATADAPPATLYAEGDGSFEFQRTVSRLVEMQREGWGRG